MTKPVTSIPKTLYINFLLPIEPPQVNGLIGMITQALGQHHPDALYFLFSSPGGYVDTGITLYNFLKSLPVHVTMHNIGSIKSIANVVFMAGQTRYAVPHSSFLFHGVEFRAEGKLSFSLQKLKEIVSSLELDQSKISGLLSENTELSKQEIEKLFWEGESKGTSFAQDKKIINDVKAVQIPQGATILTIG